MRLRLRLSLPFAANFLFGSQYYLNAWLSLWPFNKCLVSGPLRICLSQWKRNFEKLCLIKCGCPISILKIHYGNSKAIKHSLNYYICKKIIELGKMSERKRNILLRQADMKSKLELKLIGSEVSWSSTTSFSDRECLNKTATLKVLLPPPTVNSDIAAPSPLTSGATDVYVNRWCQKW